MDKSEFLASLKGKRLLVLAHSGADVDAVGAAGALFFAFGKKADMTLAAPDHINLYAASFAKKLSIPISTRVPDLKSFDRLILLDLNSLKMLGSAESSVREFKGPILLIDHHNPLGEKITPKQLALVDSKAVSTTELVYRLLLGKAGISPKTAACIAAGIITDSANFLVADHSTFSIMADVVKKAKRSYPELLALFTLDVDASEKIAKLKAARRCRIYKGGNFIIAATDVSAFEAGAATVLVRIGADVAFAGDAKNGEAKISGRANNLMVENTGFDIVKCVFSRLSEEFGGHCGGHPAAAGYNGSAQGIKPMLKRCVELTHEFLCGKCGVKTPLKEYA